jgi:hypothetical protein
MLFYIYTAHLKYVVPLYADLEGTPFPSAAILFGVLAWYTLVAFVPATVRKMRGGTRLEVWSKNPTRAS